MVKFLLGVAIVGFCAFLGRTLAGKYRRRKQFFKQWEAFNERFIAEITYYRRPIGNFIAAYAYEGEFNELLSDYIQSLKQGVLLESFLQDKSRYTFLKAEEKSSIHDYFYALGRGDTSSQKVYFSSMKGRLSTWQEETEKEEKKYGDLYVKIGFLCGLLILILII